MYLLRILSTFQGLLFQGTSLSGYFRINFYGTSKLPYVIRITLYDDIY